MKHLNKRLISALLFIVSIVLRTGSVNAKIVLPSVFSDNMVMQQKTNAAIWGKGTPGHNINISTTWSKKIYVSRADKNGNWKILVATPSYGGPYTITISDGAKITLKNILIGDVWVCSGQSNMEMPLVGWGKIKNYKEEITQAKYPDIRLLQVNRKVSNVPLENAEVANGGWVTCTPETVAGFSATAYFFAREVIS